MASRCEWVLQIFGKRKHDRRAYPRPLEFGLYLRFQIPTSNDVGASDRKNGSFGHLRSNFRGILIGTRCCRVGLIGKGIHGDHGGQKSSYYKGFV